MGQTLAITTPLHLATQRDYLARMNDNKAYCMDVAQAYGADYWDGERRYGYGGYKYIPGWWEPVARGLIDHYQLKNDSSVLDVGCGKGFLLYELKKILPRLDIAGFDLSAYGISNAHPEVKKHLFVGSAEEEYPYEQDRFDLVLSIGCLHNLRLPGLEVAIPEIQRVGRKAYTMLESYRSNTELFNLQCWALTAQTFLDVDEWGWLYRRLGYTGDYEFIFFD